MQNCHQKKAKCVLLNVGSIIPNLQRTMDPEIDLCLLLVERYMYVPLGPIPFFNFISVVT